MLKVANRGAVAAFGSFGDPVELFAACRIANVAGLLLLVSFGVIGSVATLGVLGWRLVYSGCRSRSAPPLTSPSRCRASPA